MEIKISVNSKHFFIGLILLVSMLGISSISVAQSTTEDKPRQPTATCDQCVVEAITKMKKRIEGLIWDLVNEIAKWIDQESSINNALVNNDKEANTATRNMALNLANYHFAGDDVLTKDNGFFIENFAEGRGGDISKMPDSIYTGSALVPDPSPQPYGDIAATASIDTLLNPPDYKYTEAKQRVSAKLFIRYLEEIAPPPPKIIHISNKFKIDFSPDPAEQNGTTIDMTKFQSDNIRPSDIQNKLETQYGELYAKYKKNYFSLIAVRNMLLNNFLRIYQARIPSIKVGKGEDKSAAELDYESATWRLKNDYYKNITEGGTALKGDEYVGKVPVSPAVVQREMLFVLAEIRHDLYRLRQQNEQLIALQSLTGLLLFSIAKTPANKMIAKEIEEIIYCTYSNRDKRNQYCNNKKESTSRGADIVRKIEASTM